MPPPRPAPGSLALPDPAREGGEPEAQAQAQAQGGPPPAPLPRREAPPAAGGLQLGRTQQGGPGTPGFQERRNSPTHPAPGPGERRGLSGPGLSTPGLARPDAPTGAAPSPTPPPAAPAPPGAPGESNRTAAPAAGAPPATGLQPQPGIPAAPATPGPGAGAPPGAPTASGNGPGSVFSIPAPGLDAGRDASEGEVRDPSAVDLTQTTFSKLQRLSASNPEPRQLVEAWLSAMAKTNASDLILRAGGRPSTRIDGRIGFLPGRVPGPGPLMQVLKQLLGEERMEHWKSHGSADSALHLDGLGRYRLNAYKQMGEPALVIRRIRETAPVLEDLELPADQLTRIAMRKRGLILVTGVAGSGKSTTLSALIQHMNTSAERHVVTLEDPVELLFTEKRCVISQREVGTDCLDFQDGLRHALRQSPDVILIGEMRDAETVTAALDASETGHLVLSTMHTVNAAQTLDRILGFYRAERHGQVRMRLADNLAGVLSQRLVPRAAGKGLVPACELMTSNPRIRELLELGQTMEIARVIDQGGDPGLISFNQSLRRLVQAKLVDLKDALSASDKPDELVLALRGITQGRGQEANQSQQPRQQQQQQRQQQRRSPGPPPRDGGGGRGGGGLSLGS